MACATNDSMLCGPAPSRVNSHVSMEKTPPPPQVARRRRISPEAGRAIEILGHAIEYLADEHALACVEERQRIGTGKHPQVAAIELLMARNREVYFSCPEVPTLSERLRAWLHVQRA